MPEHDIFHHYDEHEVVLLPYKNIHPHHPILLLLPFLH